MAGALLRERLQLTAADHDHDPGTTEAEIQRLVEHIVKQGDGSALGWLLHPSSPAASDVCHHALANDLLDVAATDCPSAACVRLLLARGADPVGNRSTPTLLAVLNRLRFLSSGSESEQARKASRLRAVAEALIESMSPAQLNAQDYRHFSALSFAAFYALDEPARLLLRAGADPYATIPFNNNNAIEWDKGNANARVKAELELCGERPEKREARARIRRLIETAPYWSSLCKLRAIVDASESPSTITTDRRFGFLCGRVETGGPLPGVEIAPPTANKVGGKVAGVLEQALHGLNADLWKELQGLLAP